GQVESVETENRIRQLTAALAETEGQSEQFSAERAGMEATLAAALEDLDSARRRVDALEEELAATRDRLDATPARGAEYEVGRARLLSDAEHVRRDGVSELAQSIEQVVEAAREARTSGPVPVEEIPADEEEEGGEPVDDDIPLPADPAEAARARLDQI